MTDYRIEREAAPAERRAWPRTGAVDRPLRVLVALILALAAGGVAAWLLLRPAGERELTASAAIVNSTQLVRASVALDHPIFWVGERTGVGYEFMQATTGESFVRYLPAGVAAASPGEYLTVATYPMQDAYATTDALSRRAGASRITVPGGVGFSEQLHPRSVFLAFRNSSFQIEVFDPSPGIAASLVQSGSVTAVGGDVDVAGSVRTLGR